MHKGIWFLLGVCVGAYGTYVMLRKDEKEISEPIKPASVPKKDDPEPQKEESKNDISDEILQETKDSILRHASTMDPDKRKEMEAAYDRLVNLSMASGYLQGEDSTLADDGKQIGPYVISPDEYGQKEDYGNVDLVYFADGVLTDEMGAIMTDEDIEDSVGKNFANYFGTYEKDTVQIRNDIRGVDYYIERDLRNSKDVAGVHKPSPPLQWRDGCD